MLLINILSSVNVGGGTVAAGGLGVSIGSGVSESFEHARNNIGIINTKNKLIIFLLLKFEIVGFSIV
jgi:hypothetical protein